MKILVIGASQGTGALCVSVALERAHQVTAFSRSADKLALAHARLSKVSGDFHDAQSVARAITGQDAVVVTAAAGSLRAFKAKPDFFSSGTRNVVAAMKVTGPRRLVVLSALFVGDSRPLANFILRVAMVDGLLKVPYADHEVQERVVRDSGLEWVIGRPSRLTNGPARGQYKKTTRIEPVPKAISRADVAAFLIDSCEQSTFVGQAVQMGG